MCSGFLSFCSHLISARHPALQPCQDCSNPPPAPQAATIISSPASKGTGASSHCMYSLYVLVVWKGAQDSIDRMLPLLLLRSSQLPPSSRPSFVGRSLPFSVPSQSQCQSQSLIPVSIASHEFFPVLPEYVTEKPTAIIIKQRRGKVHAPITPPPPSQNTLCHPLAPVQWTALHCAALNRTP